MKYKLIFLILLNSAFGFSQKAEFKFIDSNQHQFGRVNEGIILEHYFVFENVGQAPLVIDEALVSCSCTKVRFPEYPITPNQRDSILVIFDTNQKYYQQDRVIKLKANTQKKEKLRFKTYVIPKED